MTSSQPLADQVALVAGATRGAGRGTALALAEAGAYVYCTGRGAAGQDGGMQRPETIDETVALIIERGGRAKALCVDHTQVAAVAELAEQIAAESGRLDVLVNSIWGADAMIGWGQSFWQIDVTELDAYLQQTLASHIITNRYLAPPMIEAGRGLIVELVDGHLSGYRGNLTYDLTKAALIRLSYAMAMELLQTGVTALSLSPGFLRSEAVLDHFGVTAADWHDAIEKDPYFAESESPQLVGRGVAALAADPMVKQKAGQVFFAADLAREYGFTDVDGRVPDFQGLFDRKVRAMAESPPLDDEEQFYALARYCQIHQDTDRYDLAVLLADSLGLKNLGPGLGPLQSPLSSKNVPE